MVDPVAVDLALQGGGSHGAFTWGVLDRLLEEPQLRFDGISGTSAGAMNAAVLVDGYEEGGPEGARASLESFWRSVSRAAAYSPFRRTALDVLLGRWTLDYSPMYLATDIMARLFSPYDLNPTGSNPLRDILATTVDFSRLSASPIKLFVTATNVHTGRGRVFRNSEITSNVLLASACLPTMFKLWKWTASISGRRLFRQSHHHTSRKGMCGQRYHPEFKLTPYSVRERLELLAKFSIE